MAKVMQRPKAKLVVGIMYSNGDIIGKIEDILIKRFGQIENIVMTYPFSFTNYYEKEMGKKLRKTLVAFRRTINRESLAAIKVFTNRIEDRFSKKGRRKVNIDPGYLTMHNFVLASAKELPHRASIGKGMFADVVLTFKDGRFHDTRTTFPDYKSSCAKEYLLKIRDIYSKQIDKKIISK